MIPSLVISVLVSLTAADAPIVRLSIADSPGEGPYQPVRVEIENPLATPVETIEVSSLGAPSVKASLIVPLRQKGELALLLPATSPLQNYQVKLSGGGQLLARQRVSLAWPAQRVHADAFRDPAVGAWTESPDDWPAALRVHAAVLLGLLVALGLLCYVLRWPWAATAGVLLIAALTTGTAWKLLAAQPLYELHLWRVQAGSGSAAVAGWAGGATSPASRPAEEEVIVIQPLRSVSEVALNSLCYGVSPSGNPPPVTIDPQRGRTFVHLKAGQVQVLKMAESATAANSPDAGSSPAR